MAYDYTPIVQDEDTASATEESFPSPPTSLPPSPTHSALLRVHWITLEHPDGFSVSMEPQIYKHMCEELHVKTLVQLFEMEDKLGSIVVRANDGKRRRVFRGDDPFWNSLLVAVRRNPDHVTREDVCLVETLTVEDVIDMAAQRAEQRRIVEKMLKAERKKMAAAQKREKELELQMKRRIDEYEGKINRTRRCSIM